MKVLVTGATGHVGSVVITEVLKRGAEVRALVRKQEGNRLPASVEIAVGDLLDPVSLATAMDGVDKLFLLNGVVAEELTQALIVCGLAKRAGLEHVTYLSVFMVEQFRLVPHFASKLAVEGASRTSGVSYTILRPGFYMQNDADLKESLTARETYPTPIGTQGIAAVDVRDIAEAAAISLTQEGHEGQTYDLVGPANLTGPKAAAIWSGALGKQIRYAGEDYDAWEAQRRNMAPTWSAYDKRMMLQGFSEHGFASTAFQVERLTKLLGRAPRRYENLVAELAQAWKQERL